MLRFLVVLISCLSTIHCALAEDGKRLEGSIRRSAPNPSPRAIPDGRQEYWKLLSERRHGWSQSAPTSLLWELYITYADRAAKLKDHKRALILAEAALEHTRAWQATDERTVRTLDQIKRNCQQTGLIVEGDDKILSVVAREAPLPIPDFMKRQPPRLEANVSIESLIRESDLLAVEGKSAQALATYLKVLAAQEREPAKDGRTCVMLIDRITRLYYKEHRYRDAEDLVRKELKSREGLAANLHDKDPERLELAFLIADLGLAYTGQERFYEAEALYQECLHIMRSFMKEDHPDAIVTLSSLALVHKYMGDTKSARKEYALAIALSKHQPLISGQSVAVIMDNYAKMLRKEGDIQQAERIEAQARRRGGHSIVHN